MGYVSRGQDQIIRTLATHSRTLFKGDCLDWAGIWFGPALIRPCNRWSCNYRLHCPPHPTLHGLHRDSPNPELMEERS